MPRALRDRLLVVWAALVAATFVTFWLGADHGLGSGAAAALAVIAIGFAKIRLVGIHFMELGGAPLPARLFLEGYVVVVTAALAILYLATG